jgi:hypothetical protein
MAYAARNAGLTLFYLDSTHCSLRTLSWTSLCFAATVYLELEVAVHNETYNNMVTHINILYIP